MCGSVRVTVLVWVRVCVCVDELARLCIKQTAAVLDFDSSKANEQKNPFETTCVTFSYSIFRENWYNKTVGMKFQLDFSRDIYIFKHVHEI